MTTEMTLIKITKTLASVLFYLNCALALLLLFLGPAVMFYISAGTAVLMFGAYKLFENMEKEQARAYRALESRAVQHQERFDD